MFPYRFLFVSEQVLSEKRFYMSCRFRERIRLKKNPIEKEAAIQGGQETGKTENGKSAR